MPILAIAAVLLCVDTAAGATGGVYSTPSTGKPSKSGLSLLVDTMWVESRGYRRVRVTASPGQKPLASDKEITVVFEARSQYYPYGSTTSVVEEFLLPAGAAGATLDIAVPQQHPWNAIEYDIFVDGEYVKDLSATHQLGWSTNDTWTNTPHVLIVQDGVAPPNRLKSLETVIFAPSNGNPARALGFPAQTTTDAQNIPPAVLATSQNTMTLSAADLPDRWILYSSFDVVCLSARSLSDLAANHPGRWNALQAWTRSGGNLFVYDVGGRWQQLSGVERALGLLPVGEDVETEGAEAEVALDDRGWRRPTGEERSLDLSDMNPFATATYDASGNLIAVANPQNQAGDKNQSEAVLERDRTHPRFAWRDHGLGRVVVLQSDKPFESPGDSIEWVFGTMGRTRALWQDRHGLNPDEQNLSFWNLLIPGIGLPPINEFRVLITLFVIVIGPLNCWWLWRTGRPQMLLFTVPGGAAVATLGLFLFAVLSDGLATRVRARSFTLIDQTQGDEIAWSRLSYYAGMRPSDGLQFDADTLVLPLPASTGGSYYQQTAALAHQREMEWSDGQSLRRGWLNARTPTQYLTVRARPTRRRLDIETTGEKVNVTNHLGIPIAELFVMDEAGDMHKSSGVASSSTVEMQEVESATGLAEIDKILRTHRPVAPQAASPVAQNIGYSANRWLRDYDGSATQATSRLEQSIRSVAMPGDEGGIWLPRIYLAILESAAPGDLGVEGASEEASFHVIVGRW